VGRSLLVIILHLLGGEDSAGRESPGRRGICNFRKKKEIKRENMTALVKKTPPHGRRFTGEILVAFGSILRTR